MLGFGQGEAVVAEYPYVVSVPALVNCTAGDGFPAIRLAAGAGFFVLSRLGIGKANILSDSGLDHAVLGRDGMLGGTFQRGEQIKCGRVLLGDNQAVRLFEALSDFSVRLDWLLCGDADTFTKVYVLRLSAGCFVNRDGRVYFEI